DVAAGRGAALPYVAEVAASGGSPSAAVGAAAWGGFPRGELPREVVAVVEAALGSRTAGLRRWVVAAVEAVRDSQTVDLRRWVVAAVEAVRDSQTAGLHR